MEEIPQAPPPPADILPELNALLHHYAHVGNVSMLEDVFNTLELSDEKKHDVVNYKDPISGALLFHSAAKSGKTEALRLLCPRNRDATTTAGTSALHIAARYGHAEAVHWLVSDRHNITKHEPGANCNIADMDGNTPLHHAVMFRRKDVAVALVKTGACLSKLNKVGLMPISYCRDSETFDEIVAAFIARYADQRHSLTDSSCTCSNTGVNVRDIRNKSILHYAAIFSKLSTLIAALVQKDFGNSQALDKNGDHEFLRSAAEVGNVHVLEALRLYLGQHATELLDSHGRNIAIHALLSNQRPFLDELLDMASDSGSAVSVGITLNSLIENIPPEIIRRLEMEKDGKDAVEFFPMYVLLYAGKFQAFEFLLDCGDRQFNLTVNQWDAKHLRTCLHWAALHQRTDIVEVLLNGSGGSFRIDDKPRPPPAAGGQRMVAGEWRRRQPSPTIQDKDGKTSLQIAFEKRNQDVLEAMRGKTSFRKHEDRLYKDRDVYVQGLHAILVGAALIAGVSFAGWLQLPSTEFDHLSMKIFWASNVFAFYTALAAMCISIAVLVPTPRMYIGTIVMQVRAAIVLDAGVFAVSLVSVGTAFGAAAIAAMSPSPSDRRAPADPYRRIMQVAGPSGLFFFCTTMLFFLRQFYKYFPRYVHILLRSFVVGCVPLPLGEYSRKLYPQADMTRLSKEVLILPGGATSPVACPPPP